MPRTADLDRILEGLHSGDEKVREESRDDLSRLRHRAEGLTPAEGLKALHAAAQGFPFERPDPDELSEYLVQVAAQSPRPEYVPVVVSSFERFGDRAKYWALAILAQLEDRAAAEAYMEVLRAHAEQGRVPRLVVGPLEQMPRHADVFFPEILRYARTPNLAHEIYRLCLAYCDAGLLSPETLAPYAGQVLADYRTQAEQLRPAQRPEGVAWMSEEGYAEGRFQASLLLDLLGYFPSDETEAELCRALTFHDPRLKHFAIASLLRQGKDVDPEVVEETASHAEMRNWLYDVLRERGRLSLFPERFRTQAALAESDMVRWLTFPTELGRVPDEIELMEVIPVDTGLPGGVYDYYLFRFRTHEPHWAAEKGWTAGVSGPFRRSDEPTTEALGETFSTFEAWDSKSPEEHVGDLQELMDRWREDHDRRE